MVAKSIRLLCQSREVDQRLDDRSTGAVPAIWAGDEVTVDCLFLAGGMEETDFSDVQTITLEILSSDGTLLLTQSIVAGEIDGAATQETFAAGTAQHARFSLGSAETLFGSTTPKQRLTLALYLTRAGGNSVTLATTALWVHKPLHRGGGTAPALPQLYYTAAQIDALLAGLGGVGGGGGTTIVVGGGGEAQITISGQTWRWQTYQTP